MDRATHLVVVADGVRPPGLQLSEGLAVMWQWPAVGADDSEVRQDLRPALLCSLGLLLLRWQLVHAGLEVGERADRAQLRHAWGSRCCQRTPSAHLHSCTQQPALHAPGTQGTSWRLLLHRGRDPVAGSSAVQARTALTQPPAMRQIPGLWPGIQGARPGKHCCSCDMGHAGCMQ